MYELISFHMTVFSTTGPSNQTIDPKLQL
jgi:hypothetical protein